MNNAFKILLLLAPAILLLAALSVGTKFSVPGNSPVAGFLEQIFSGLSGIGDGIANLLGMAVTRF